MDNHSKVYALLEVWVETVVDGRGNDGKTGFPKLLLYFVIYESRGTRR